MDKCLMNFQELSLNVKNVFGEDYVVEKVVRLYGGAQKGTYKIQCTNKFPFVLYIWNEKTNYFSKYNDESDVFKSSGADLFLASHKVFVKNDIPVQKLYYIDATRKTYDFDYAFVEYIIGKEIENYMDNSHTKGKQLFISLGDNIRKLHSIKSSFAGNVDNLRGNEFRCEKYILTSIEKDMIYLVENCSEVKLKESEIRKSYEKLYENIKPRNDYSFIHGELGPNHVLMDEKQNICFIDIETAKYFDREFEISFSEFRFGDYYNYLREENIDVDRMKFYKLYHHIGCLTGAHQLTKENYYDMKEVYGMINYNLKQVLEFANKL